YASRSSSASAERSARRTRGPAGVCPEAPDVNHPGDRGVGESRQSLRESNDPCYLLHPCLSRPAPRLGWRGEEAAEGNGKFAVVSGDGVADRGRSGRGGATGGIRGHSRRSRRNRRSPPKSPGRSRALLAVRPEMAPQALEKVDSAEGNGAAAAGPIISPDPRRRLPEAPPRREQARRPLRRSANPSPVEPFQGLGRQNLQLSKAPPVLSRDPAEKNFARAPRLPACGGGNDRPRRGGAISFRGINLFKRLRRHFRPNGRTASNARDRPGLFGGLRRFRRDRECPRMPPVAPPRALRPRSATPSPETTANLRLPSAASSPLHARRGAGREWRGEEGN